MGCPSAAGSIHFGGWPGKRLERPQQGTMTFIVAAFRRGWNWPIQNANW